MELLKCARCGHEWYQRTPEKPRRCAGCKCLYWERAARVPRVHHEPGKLGAPLKFPELDTLQPGGMVLLKWGTNAAGMPDLKHNAKLSRCASRKAAREGWSIRFEPKPQGLCVIRIA